MQSFTWNSIKDTDRLGSIYPGTHIILPINSGSKIYKHNSYYINCNPAYLMNLNHCVIFVKLNLFSKFNPIWIYPETQSLEGNEHA